MSFGESRKRQAEASPLLHCCRWAKVLLAEWFKCSKRVRGGGTGGAVGLRRETRRPADRASVDDSIYRKPGVSGAGSPRKVSSVHRLLLADGREIGISEFGKNSSEVGPYASVREIRAREAV